MNKMRVRLWVTAAMLCAAVNAAGVERAGEEYFPLGAKNTPVYLVVTPPEGLQVQNKSGDAISWRDQVVNQVNEVLPGNKSGADRQPLPHDSWDGSLTFKIEAGEVDDIRSAASSLQSIMSMNKSGNAQDVGTVTIDEMKYPMIKPVLKSKTTKTPDKLWMYHSPDTDLGAANIAKVWDKSQGESITVAVLDTGTIKHKNFKNVLPGYDFISDPLISQDDDETRDADPTDEGDYLTAGESNSGEFQSSSWHGSHVQGTIAGSAVGDFVGVAPKAKILPIRVLGKGGGYDTDIMDGAAYAGGLPVGDLVNPYPAQVINMSLGSDQPSPCNPRYQKLFDALAAKGVTVLVAAGNSSDNSESYAPGNCKNIITVGSSARQGRSAYYSNTGANIGFMSPGGEEYERFWHDEDQTYYLRGTPGNGVLSTVSSDVTTLTDKTHDSYAFYEGTSMATPVAAGVVALLQSYSVQTTGKLLTVENIRKALSKTARPFPVTDDEGLNCSTDRCGSGLIDAKAALGHIEKRMGVLPIEPEPEHMPVLPSSSTCYSDYTIAIKLYGPVKAKKMFPSGQQYEADCPAAEPAIAAAKNSR